MASSRADFYAYLEIAYFRGFYYWINVFPISRGNFQLADRFLFRRKMKEINAFELVTVPEGITASVKSRVITVKGPRGTLTKDFKHLAIDIYMPKKDTIKVIF